MSRARFRLVLKTTDPAHVLPQHMSKINGVLPSWHDVELFYGDEQIHCVRRVLFEAQAGADVPRLVLEVDASDVEIDVPAGLLDETLREENERLRVALKQIENYEEQRDPAVNSLYSMMVAHGALAEGRG